MEIMLNPDSESKWNLELIKMLINVKLGNESNNYKKISYPEMVRNAYKKIRSSNSEEDELTEKDKFLISKYRYYTIQTINKLGNRGDYLNEKHAKNQILIEEKELFKNFVQFCKLNHVFEIDIHLFKRAIESLIGVITSNQEEYYAYFYMEKTDIKGKVFYSIQF